MNATLSVDAVVFDAYGTLFDIHAPTANAAAAIGDPAIADTLGKMWRDKQLQYSWLRAVMGAYTPFWQITQDALDYCLEALKLDDPKLRQSLLDLYFRIDAYPDAIPALQALKTGRMRTAVLTNGSREMVDAAITSSGAAGYLDDALSVADVGIFKPDKRVYQHAVDRLGVAKERMGFVSCNGWDAWAAADFGFQVVWLNRFGLPEEKLPGAPKRIIPDMTTLPAVYGL